MWTMPSWGVSLSDATIQPIRHPIIRCSQATPPSVTVRSRIPSSAAGTTTFLPPKTIASIALQ